MIVAILSKPYRVVEQRLTTYLRRYLAQHHETCADWVPEISEPMFRQLIEDGLRRTFGLYIFLLVIVLAPLVFAHAEERLISVIVTAVSGSGLFLLNWRIFATQCVDREFLYRRLHGKWRWER